MNYYEKLGWKMGKENEIFLKKGSEKLFFEILEKLNPKYVEVPFKSDELDFEKYFDKACDFYWSMRNNDGLSD